MGCWEETDAITDRAIEAGDKVVLTIWNRRDTFEYTGELVEAFEGYFEGVYNDYGSLEDASSELQSLYKKSRDEDIFFVFIKKETWDQVIQFQKDTGVYDEQASWMTIEMRGDVFFETHGKDDDEYTIRAKRNNAWRRHPKFLDVIAVFEFCKLARKYFFSSTYFARQYWPEQGKAQDLVSKLREEDPIIPWSEDE